MGVTAQLRELAHFGERRVQIGEEAVGCASIVAHGVGAEGGLILVNAVHVNMDFKFPSTRLSRH
jgi:hypothetical protein